MSSQQKLQINERAQAVLGHIVDSYTASGQPIGSKILAEQSGLQLSPASIRIVMQDLERQGMLTHPHTSAGRVPSEDGFRYYAQNLVKAGEIEAKVKQELQQQADPKRNFNLIVKDVNQTLSQLTQCASLVSAPKREQNPLEQIEFIRLSDGRVLAVIVSAGGHVENRVIEVPDFIDIAELNAASADMKKLIAGQTLGAAREALIAGLAEQKGRINEMIDQMMAAANTFGEAPVTDGALMVMGSNNLFQYPELVRERLQGLIRMFEEKRLLMALMDEVQQGQGVQVFVGKDAPLEEAKDCSIIASSYGAEGVVGTLGVIGPMRMNYKQTIGLVDYTAQLLSETLREQNKK